LASILVQPTRQAHFLVVDHYAHPNHRCVGVWQNDRVEIIANDQGNRTTPSYVSFSESERLIGDAAKNQVAMNPHNTYVHAVILSLYHLTHVYASVFDAKRLIGRKFSDPDVQADLKHFPFKVIDKQGKPYIVVQYRGEDKEFVSCRLIPSNLICAHTVRSRPRRSRPWFF
jgi:molecular chaperone DnaK (HSP70)